MRAQFLCRSVLQGTDACPFMASCGVSGWSSRSGSMLLLLALSRKQGTNNHGFCTCTHACCSSLLYTRSPRFLLGHSAARFRSVES